MLTGARSGAPAVVKPAVFEAELKVAKRELMLEATNATAEGCIESLRLQDGTCYVLRCTEEELVQLRIAIVEAEMETYDGSPPQGPSTGSSDTVYEVIWKEIASKRSEFRDMLSCARWAEKLAALAWENEMVKLNLMDDVFRAEPMKLAKLGMLCSNAVNGRLWQADGLMDGLPSSLRESHIKRSPPAMSVRRCFDSDGVLIDRVSFDIRVIFIASVSQSESGA